MVLIRACVQCVGSLPASSILWWNLVIGVLPSSQTYFWYCDRYATYTIVAPLYFWYCDRYTTYTIVAPLYAPGILKLFSKKCVCVYACTYACMFVCLYICLSVCTHVSKALEAKSSLYTRNEGYIDPVLNL